MKVPPPFSKCSKLRPRPRGRGRNFENCETAIFKMLEITRFRPRPMGRGRANKREAWWSIGVPKQKPRQACRATKQHTRQAWMVDPKIEASRKATIMVDPKIEASCKAGMHGRSGGGGTPLEEKLVADPL